MERELRRQAASRQPAERVLIVCEGEKTEPQYLEEIRQELRLATANVMVLRGALGTAPLQVVQYAEDVFRNGDRARGIDRLAFDRIAVVFDRDDHPTYHQALGMAAALSGRLTNDDRRRIPVDAVASVPCFELWLLLHFTEVHAPLHRNEVHARLQAYLPNYEKGQSGLWGATKERLDAAVARAAALAAVTNEHDGQQPFTSMHRLVEILRKLKG